MNTLLVDPPAAQSSEQPIATDGNGTQPGGPPDGGSPPRGRTCSNCAAAIGEDQQWCLRCGAAQPGSLGAPVRWRPLSTLTLVAIVLAAGAAVAGAAALGSHKAPRRAVALVTAPTPTTSVPAATPPAPSTPATPGTATTPTVPAVKGSAGGAGASGALFPPTGKAPKLPVPAATPKAPSGTGSGTGAGGSSGAGTGAGEITSSTPKSKSKGAEGKAEAPSAILLDTNAANTYNPYNYPAAGFGDPALAIDGEPLTAWTAQVQPSSAPNMAEGLLIDLKSPTKLGAVTLSTLSEGMTVQLYGANGKQAPATITAPGWTQLSGTRVLKKRTTHLKLHGKPSLRWVLVWVVKAPASAVGTPQAPGHVNLNEVELFPPVA